MGLRLRAHVLVAALLVTATAGSAAADHSQPDTTSPTFSAASVDRTEVTAGDTVNVLTDLADESGLGAVELRFRGPGVHYLHASARGSSTIAVPIDDTTVDGTYRLISVGARDTHGNWTSCHSEYEALPLACSRSDAGWGRPVPLDPPVEVAFTVSGTGADGTSPTFSAAAVDRATAAPGETVVLTTDLADDRALGEGFASFTGPQDQYLQARSSGSGTFRVSLGPGTVLGTYRLTLLYARDTRGNSIGCGARDGQAMDCIRSSDSDGTSPPPTPLDPPVEVTFTVVRDHDAPVVTGRTATPPNAAGWHRDPVDVLWHAVDPAPSEGPASTPPATAAGTEGANVPYTSAPSCDAVGNCSTGTHRVSLDLTDPTVVAGPVPAGNEHGWHSRPVEVAFRCSDAVSGVASCTDAVTVGEGKGGVARGEATDVAGRSASTVLTGLDVDLTAPVVALATAAGTYTPDQTIAVTCAVRDALSGVDERRCPASRLQAHSLRLGRNVLTAEATDRAGNPGAAAASVDVRASFPSQRALTSMLVVNQQTAAELNAVLTSAETAPLPALRTLQLEHYKRRVMLEVDRSVTPASAEVLTHFSGGLS